MENWTIQHAANAWKSGSHQIHFDDKGKLELLQRMAESIGFNYIPFTFEYYSACGDSWSVQRIPFNLPTIPISQITEDNDFKWGEEVEVSDDGMKWGFDKTFLTEAKSGLFVTQDNKSKLCAEWKYCRRPVKEQPIYTKADLDEALEKLNKIINHFRDRL
jgi:hypothetical protein